jgi:hypothetical protein
MPLSPVLCPGERDWLAPFAMAGRRAGDEDFLKSVASGLLTRALLKHGNYYRRSNFPNEKPAIIEGIVVKRTH